MSSTEAEKAISGLWDQHMASEFGAKSTDQALATMSANPHVNMVPVMNGAIGREQLAEFYSKHFLNQIPPDMEMVSVSRTVGQGRIVDEMVAQTEDGKIAHEHLYWDQATVLVQLGLMDRSLPVRGAETSQQVLKPTQPMNELIRRAAP